MSSPSAARRTILRDNILSNHLNENRPMRIYLPPGYNELLSYPVIYCQDGEEFFNFGRIATAANHLILEEGMEPIIIIGVDVNKQRRTEDYSPDGARFHAYCRFFLEELVPYVESKYPIRSTSNERVLAGDSLGGAVSLHLAMHHSAMFNRVISLSGAFFNTTQNAIQQQADLSRLDLFLLVGLEESAVTTDTGTYDFVEANRISAAMLQARGADVEYIEQSGQHLWGFWQNYLPQALMHYFG